MEGQKPEIVFGSNVAVWRNVDVKNDVERVTRSITISPRRYKDQNGNWVDAKNWNVSDLAHLAHCLTMALNHCLDQRCYEQQPQPENRF